MKRIFPFIVTIFCLATALFTSCTKGLPRGVIPTDQMENVLYDYHLAQAVGTDYNGDERYKRELLMQYVYDKHHVTKEQFDSSLMWYSRNTDKLSKIYEQVGERLSYSKDMAEEMVGTTTVMADADPIVGDTVDLWHQNRLYMLTNRDMTNKILFTIPTDTCFRSHDLLVWQAEAIFLDCDDSYQAEMELSILYKNDNIASVHRRLTRGSNKLTLLADSLEMKEIRGFIYFGGGTLSQYTQTMVVNHLTLMRYHSLGGDSLLLEEESMGKIDTDSEVEQKSTTPGSQTPRLTPQQLRDKNHPDATNARKITPNTSTHAKRATTTTRRHTTSNPAVAPGTSKAASNVPRTNTTDSGTSTSTRSSTSIRRISSTSSSQRTSPAARGINPVQKKSE